VTRGGFPIVHEVDVVSHFSVLLEGALQSEVTYTIKFWLVKVEVTTSHSFICWSMRLNQPMALSGMSLSTFPFLWTQDLIHLG
jgi:hypothetical protein